MTTTGKEDNEGPVQEPDQTGKGLGLSPIQVIAGGGAAAVASVIGGHLGLAGTVVGAFILSVISAIALPLLHASLEKSHAHIKRVIPGRVTDPARTTQSPTYAETPGGVRPTSGKVSAAPVPQAQPRARLADTRHAPHKTPGGRKAWTAIGGTAIIFLVGVGSILGFQATTGYALSSGTSALQSSVSQVVANPGDSKGTPAQSPKPSDPAVEPSSVPTGPATTPTERATPAPTPTGHTTPSPKPTATAPGNTPLPTGTPHPAVTPAGAAPTK